MKDVLVMIATVLIIVQRLGLARVHLREWWLRLIMLWITSRMLEGTARDSGGRRLAGTGRSRGAGGGRGAGSRRGCSCLMTLALRWAIYKIVLVAIIVLVKAASR